ncbi:hypothetical protein HNY73_015232 [Argiope bruennichi]|uniref:Uncharacterized protein n=1 Tax=Argiope bruennichi TaxID=94029 RepID=A0A8T0ESU7_ARGBR|nr:hypothetical protein HNY73_015232 [Argiope bruennichi]
MPGFIVVGNIQTAFFSYMKQWGGFVMLWGGIDPLVILHGQVNGNCEMNKCVASNECINNGYRKCLQIEQNN